MDWERHESIARNSDANDPLRAMGDIAKSIGQQLRTLAISFECFGEQCRYLAAERDGEKAKTEDTDAPT